MNSNQRISLVGFILCWTSMWNTDTEWLVIPFGVLGLGFYMWFIWQD